MINQLLSIYVRIVVEMALCIVEMDDHLVRKVRCSFKSNITYLLDVGLSFTTSIVIRAACLLKSLADVVDELLTLDLGWVVTLHFWIKSLF